MAIYHFSAKVISRANGSSAVASAAYRSASELYDERLERSHDFTNKAGVIHSEILSPAGTPARWAERETLWNEVEALEKRKDAQLAREVEFAIPREMTPAQGIALARDFVAREFVGRGMVADLNVHWDRGADGEAKPHAHVMLSMRTAGPEGFGAKARDWNSRELLETWRERWASHVNARLAALGIETRIDHRTLEAQGIGLEPQHKIGPAGMRRQARGEDAERAAEHREIARRNGEKIIAEPSLALDAITRQQSTFTEHDLMRFVHRHTDQAEQFAQALSAVRTSPELVALGQDGRGRARFTTREMLGVEARLERVAAALAERRGHEVSPASSEGGYVAAGQRLVLGEEQRDALKHITRGGDLALVVGYAGTGKSAMLGQAREAWEAAGWQVRGAALSGIAAENLEAGSGIGSRTIASLEHAWAQGREQLSRRDVLVIDEAGMIGSRQMERVLSAAQQAGAKVVLVGDPEQLQAIEAGAAFRALAERHGAAEITEIRRQREDWQRQATRELATGRTAAALERYEAAGMVQAHATRDEARSALVEGWDAVRRETPSVTQIMLAHTRADVAELNQLARAKLRDSGDLGEDQVLATERGERSFAAGERLMFLRNERSLGVKNGTLGTVEKISGSSLGVRLDDGREVRFDLKDYAHIDHGYAATIHKNQGVTVDRAHLLASEGLDRHAAYVGMSRHREALAVHYGADDFKDRAQLARTLSRERAKDTTLDYALSGAAAAFAERREIVVPEALAAELSAGREAAPAPRPGKFAHFKPRPPAERAPEPREGAPTAPKGGQRELIDGIRDYTRAVGNALRMREQDLPVLPHQQAAVRSAETALTKLSPERAQDLKSAIRRDPGLARGVDQPGGLQAVIRAVNHEGRVRRDPELRAERFVEAWTSLKAERQQALGWEARRGFDERLDGMVKQLQRDPGLERALQGRRRELGLELEPTLNRSLVKELGMSLTLGRGMGLSR